MSETQIQSSICEYLARRKHLFHRANQIPVYDVKRGTYRAFPKYSLKGFPDILVLTDGGFAVFLEVKAQKGRQSPEQKEFQKRCEEKGCEYHVVRSIDDVRNIGL